MSKQQEVNLTEEEKETLRAEGLPIPTTLPLTKVLLNLRLLYFHVHVLLFYFAIFTDGGESIEDCQEEDQE